MRSAPPKVDPVIVDGIEYTAPWDMMGSVVATDIGTGCQLWWRQIYAVKYIPGLEPDVQWVYISSLKADDGVLRIENEDGNKYELDLNTLEVKATKGSISVSYDSDIFEEDTDSQIHRIADSLLANRQKPVDFWHWIFPGKPVSLAEANKFMLGSILDYQVSAATAWENGRRLAEDICGNPEQVWKWVTDFPPAEWNAKWKEFGLHRFPKAHERIWRIGKCIMERYQGDPRKIWEGRSPAEVLERLYAMRVGEQISRMIVGALIDTGKISGKADVKVDIHVRRVLGRLVRGKEYPLGEENEVLRVTREMSPDNPWLLDEQLYLLGKSICTARQAICDKCYMNADCAYRSLNSAGS